MGKKVINWFLVKEKKKGILIVCLIVAMMFFLVGFVSSDKVITNNALNGYQIFAPAFDVIPSGQNFNLHVHASNISTGRPLLNTEISCYLHLYNITGNHTFESRILDKDSNLLDHEIFIDGANFTQGQHGFYIWCNSTDFGGEIKGLYEVTYSGKQMSSSNAILYVPLFLVFFFIFFVVIFLINLLPSENTRDEEGKLVSISLLKYLRPILAFIAWMLFIGIVYVASNLSFAYLPDTLVADLLFKLFYICFGLTLPIIVVWFIYIFAQIIDDKRMRALWERGMFEQKI